MAEYLDKVFTEETLADEEFINEVSKDLADITGYEEKKPAKNVEDEEDPLDVALRKDTVEIQSVKKNVVNNLSNEDKVKILRKPRDKSSIAVDENNDIFCKSWGNYYIVGGDYYEESVMIINEYLEESTKPVKERDFSKFEIGKKNVVEKFKDMDLHKGKFDISGFYENVV